MDENAGSTPAGGSILKRKKIQMKYLIKNGDTLSQIAREHGVTVNDIMKANDKIKDRNLIYAGKYINIPIFTNPLGFLARIWNWYKSLFKL